MFPPQAQNPFADMRMRNLFQPDQAAQQLPSGNIGMNQGLQQPPVVQPQPGGSPSVDINAILSGMTNATPAETLGPLSDVMSKKLQSAIDMMPQRGDYKPSKFRKALAGIASLSAQNPEQQQKVIEDIQYKPYEQDMNDWLTHVRALMEGASEEDKQNINRRFMALGLGNLDIRGRQAATAEERVQAYAAHQNALNEHIKWLETHPKWQKIERKGGNIYYWNPEDPAAEPYDSGLPSGRDTDDEIQKKMTERATEVANINARSRLETKQATPGRAGETPAQRKIRLANNARQALSDHPEWTPYIKMDPNDKDAFEVTPPPTGWFAKPVDKQTHDNIYDYIYNTHPEAENQPTAGAGATSPDAKPPVKPPAAPTPPKAPGTAKFLKDKDNNIYDISKWTPAQIAAARKAGYIDSDGKK